MLRIPPDIHAAVATAAEIRGKGINQLVEEILNQTVLDH
jgi:predicted HicB family RNase H-like nuclease